MNLLSSVTIKNYRAFGAEGATIPLTDEFLAIIGLNNSGKTSLVRSIYELRPIFHAISELQVGNSTLQNLFSTYPGTPLPGAAIQMGEQITPIGREGAQPQVEIELAELAGGTEQINPRVLTIYFSNQFATVDRIALTSADGTRLENCDHISGELGTIPDGMDGTFTENVIRGTSVGRQTVLRWKPVQDALAQLSDTMYIGPFRNAINSGGGGYYDIAIGSAFVDAFSNFQSGDRSEANEAISSMCEQLQLIFGFRSLQINPSPNRERLMYLIDGKSYRGSELGAGITQFVLVAANVLVRKPSWLLIDEPELNLHASLQLRFLMLLGQYVKNGVVFSTHSLGLARTGADRILVVGRDSGGWSRVDDYHAAPSLSSVLGALGHGGIHEPTYKAVLLVEGIHDVRTFQQLLAHYGVRGEVVVISLGGDDLAGGGKAAELAELCRLSSSIFAIVDSERVCDGQAAATRRSKFSGVCSDLGIVCTVLERRAIENYFSESAIRVVYSGVAEEVFGEFDKPSPAWGWSKSRNWRVAQAMTRADLQGTDLDRALKGVADLVLGG